MQQSGEFGRRDNNWDPPGIDKKGPDFKGNGPPEGKGRDCKNTDQQLIQIKIHTKKESDQNQNDQPQGSSSDAFEGSLAPLDLTDTSAGPMMNFNIGDVFISTGSSLSLTDGDASVLQIRALKSPMNLTMCFP